MSQLSNQSPTKNQPESAAKRAYQAPHLIEYGAVSELTLSISPPGTGNDGSPGPNSYMTSTS